MNRYIRPIFAVLALGLFTGCSSAVYRQPQVTLQTVQLAGLGLRGGTLLVNLEIVNPNRFALNAQELDYQVAISDSQRELNDTSWVDLATGTYSEGFSVGAGDTGNVQIPIEFSYSGLGSAASSIMRAGTFNYRASGTVDVRTPLGTYEVPFRRGGMVSLLSTTSTPQ